jgi:hypothetical protein
VPFGVSELETHRGYLRQPAGDASRISYVLRDAERPTVRIERRLLIAQCRMGVADMPEYPGLLPTISKPLLDRKRFSEKLKCLRMIAEALERDAAMVQGQRAAGVGVDRL